MLNPDYLNVLRKINTRLNNTSVNWAITGSLGFALQSGCKVRMKLRVVLHLTANKSEIKDLLKYR